MGEVYVIIVALLFLLAISDLIVGVSNDAVNFLNSAIGSKVAPRHIIMIVASLGIFVGATFSSGMMEVARKGIFFPGQFLFAEIMIIFVAVMLTDIILLDLFNTFGLPTSTTVSIVFELLGAAVAVSILKLTGSGESLQELGNYINANRAVLIISGIFLSVIFAFLFGSLIQFFSRLLFSFNYRSRLPYFGAIWGGLALSALSYFLIFKGLKGASFVSENLLEAVRTNMVYLLIGSLIFWSVFMQVMHSVFKVNIFKIIVLFGTFSLAMAFAGNDLVNFIGVPIAGYESFLAWNESGQAPDNYTMEVLNQAVRSNTWLLLIAGLVMIVTLWFSRKARTVTDTEVDLGRQHIGSERFNPNFLSRNIVRLTHGAATTFSGVMPDKWLDRIDSNFQVSMVNHHGEVVNKPAFDLVRASVNLTVASMLIAFATSLKLPLSTTYVSFMVAMGASLADRAWGRDSAVYRVAGVLNVIGGWFGTAVIAFTVSAIFATCIFSFGNWVIALLVLLAIFLVVRSSVYHKEKDEEKQARARFESLQDEIDYEKAISETSEKARNTLKTVNTAYRNALKGLIDENRSRLYDARKDVDQLNKDNKALRYRLYHYIRRINGDTVQNSQLYIHVYDLVQDLLQSVNLIVDTCLQHVENVHLPLENEQITRLRAHYEKVEGYLKAVNSHIDDDPFADINHLLEMKTRVLNDIEKMMALQVEGIQTGKYNSINSQLFFSLLLETKDLVAITARFAKLYHRSGIARSKGDHGSVKNPVREN